MTSYYARKHIFIWLYLLLSLPCFSQTPVANFTATVTSGCAPLIVQFTNTSSGTVAGTTWSWNFGNSTTPAVLRDPSTTFTQPGTYTVTLTATNPGPGGGSNTKTATAFITVYPAPTVSWTVSDSTGCPPHTATFTSTTNLNAPGGGTYFWSFGNGNTSTQTSTTQIFPNPGTYAVSLRATNSFGCITTLSQSTQIKVSPKPTAAFTANNTNFCKTSNNTVNFTATATGGLAPYNYNWAFGDGGTGTGATASHTYNSAGPFSVRLVVTDASGCVDTLLKQNYVTTTVPNAAFNTTSGCVGMPVLFSDASSPGSTSVLWNFGSAAIPSTSTSPIAVPVFNVAGTYPVTLISTVSGCSDTITKNVLISPLPTVSFTSTPALPCAIPATVNYVATGPAGSTYQWRFSNGNTATGATSSQTFTQYGIYTDTLIATAPSGCQRFVINPGNVSIYDKWPNMRVSKDSGCIPLTVTFQDSLTTMIGDPTPSSPVPYPPGIASWSWNFGDGSTSTQPRPTHIFTDTGRFWVVVTMTTTNGCVVRDSVLILAGRPPNAAFTLSPTTACVKNNINFTNTTTGAQFYSWAYGDGSTNRGLNPGYTYYAPGNYTVVLSAFHNGCVDTAQRKVLIRPPSAFFVASPDCDTPLLVRFQDGSVGVQAYRWNFGDGLFSTQSQPTHIYATAGIYNVKLVVTNTTAGCSDSMTLSLNLLPKTVSIVADDTAICKGDSVTFTGGYTGNVQSWGWFYETPMGFFPYNALTNIMGRRYTDTGRWGVMLVVTNDKGCTDSLVKNDYVLVAQPKARFIVSDSVDCAPMTVNFTDNSTDVSGVPITARFWTFGNGQTQTGGTTATVPYPLRGNYDVVFVVEDAVGCRDTVVKPTFIKSLKPIAGVNPSDTVICPGTAVVLNNASGGGLFLPSRWAFGDGDSSSLFSPTHTYNALGTYSIWLTVVDSIGCRDTLFQPNLIRVQKPVASFTSSDSQTVCPPPFAVTFTNTSPNIIASAWDYGNGFTSTLKNGGTAYTTTGIFTTSLVVTDAEGCKDTATQTIRVLGYAGALTYAPLLDCAPMGVNFSTNLQNLPSVFWDFGDGTIETANGLTAAHVYQTPGAYIPKLVISNGQGCATSSSGVDTVKVDAITARFGNSVACDGQPISFTDSSLSLFSASAGQQWIFPGNIIVNAANPNYTLGIPGDYSVQFIVTNGNGCKDTVEKTVTVYALPTIDAGKDTVVCPGNSVMLSATGGIEYSWSPATGLNSTTVATPMASPQTPIQYIVVGKDSVGCSNTDSVWVRMKAKTTGDADGDTSVCVGTSIQLEARGGTDYLWVPADGLNDSSLAMPLAKPDSSTRYLVIIRDGVCAPDSHYIQVNIYPAPFVNAGPDKGVMEGSSILVEAQFSGAVSVRWSPAEGLTCDTCRTPNAAPGKTTQYVVTGISDRGCISKDSVIIYKDCREGQLFVPNSFTPNGDGENDVFYVHGNGIDHIRSLRIYNRWGGLVFEKQNFAVNDKSTGWDGTQGGEKTPADAFVYVLEAICNTGQSIIYKGDVTLIR